MKNFLIFYFIITYYFVPTFHRLCFYHQDIGTRCDICDNAAVRKPVSSNKYI